MLAWLGGQERRRGVAVPSKPGQQKPRRNEVQFGARGLLFRMAGVDLTVIEGISATTALVILSEIGTDLSRFATEKNFVSWLGLCPQHRSSACGEDLQASGAAWRQSGSAGPADGRSGLSSRQECAGRLLSPHSSPLRWCESGGGNGAEDRRACVPVTQTRS